MGDSSLLQPFLVTVEVPDGQAVPQDQQKIWAPRVVSATDQTVVVSAAELGLDAPPRERSATIGSSSFRQPPIKVNLRRNPRYFRSGMSRSAPPSPVLTSRQQQQRQAADVVEVQFGDLPSQLVLASPRTSVDSATGLVLGSPAVSEPMRKRAGPPRRRPGTIPHLKVLSENALPSPRRSIASASSTTSSVPASEPGSSASVVAGADNSSASSHPANVNRGLLVSDVVPTSAAGPIGAGVDLDDLEHVDISTGNPTVAVSNGRLHFYRSSHGRHQVRSNVVCMTAVPSHMPPSEVCQFVAAYAPNVTHMRMVRDANPMMYMVLLRFKDQTSADLFFNDYNGRPFNQLEPETASLVYVAHVEFQESSLLPTEPPAGFYELPTCPVCLDRLDADISGLLTTQCNHTFHSACLGKWSDTSCPVCRYSQATDQESRCNDCDTTTSLWICIVCGHVGCGRYTRFCHAESHYQATGHAYAMELETQRVWDYAGDGYVHRLLQNRADGKVVEFPQPHDDHGVGADGKRPADAATSRAEADGKLISLVTEYEHLLTSQLEQQRAYYEDLLCQHRRERDDVRSSLAAERGRYTQAQNELQSRIRQVEIERKPVEKRAGQLASRVSRMEKENEHLRKLNKTLLSAEKDWYHKLEASEQRRKRDSEAKDAEIAELRAQLKDIMFYLEAQQKIAERDDADDIQHGRVIVEQGEDPAVARRRSRRKR